MKYLKLIQKNLITAIPLVMILGFITGLITDVSALKGLIMPLTFLMVYPMMVNMQLRKVLEGGDFKVQGAAQIINFAVTPFIAYFIGMIFFPENHYLRLGVLLTGLLPTSGMTISWTGMAKGNMSAAVKMTVLGLLLGSVFTPLYIKGLMGAQVSINLLAIFQQILVIVVVPLVLGSLTQVFIIKKYGRQRYQQEIKQLFPPISTIGVLGIVFVAMALKAKGIASNPMMLLSIVFPLVLLYALNFIISIITGKLFFHRENAIALLYGTVMRNLSIALAIAMTSFGKEGSDIALVIALGYIIQVQSAAWVVKLTDRIYGSAMADLIEEAHQHAEEAATAEKVH